MPFQHFPQFWQFLVVQFLHALHLKKDLKIVKCESFIPGEFTLSLWREGIDSVRELPGLGKGLKKELGQDPALSSL